MNEDLRLVLSDEEAPKPIDPIESLVAPLGRQRKLIAVTALLGAAAGVFLGFKKPNEYESSGKLLVQAGAREAATPESTITEGNASDANTRDAVNNEVHLLHDPQVFRSAAQKVGPQKILRAYDPREGDNENTPFLAKVMHTFQAWWFKGAGDHSSITAEDELRAATRQLMRGMRIQAEPYSSIIGVRYAAHSPDLAQDVVSAFLVASDEHHRATFASDSSLEFLESQVDTALADAMDADQELTAFRISCGVYDLAEQRDNLITVSHSLEQEIAISDNRLQELETLIEFITLELEDEKPTIATVDNAGLREGVAGGTTVMRTNPRWERLNESLDEARSEQTSLIASSSLKRERYYELQDKLVKLEECEPQHRLLDMDAQRKRERASRFLAAFDRADLLNLLDQVEMSNLRLVQAATYPLEKRGPLRSKLAMIGLVLGLALGIGIAYALHLFDRRLRTPRDLERALEIPLLCVVGDLDQADSGKSPLRLLTKANLRRVADVVKRKKTG